MRMLARRVSYIPKYCMPKEHIVIDSGEQCSVSLNPTFHEWMVPPMRVKLGYGLVRIKQAKLTHRMWACGQARHGASSKLSQKEKKKKHAQNV